MTLHQPSLLAKPEIDRLLQTVKENIARDGYLVPVLFVRIADGAPWFSFCGAFTK